MATLYISNDNLITLVGLTDNTDGTAITTATVTVTLVDRTGTEVSGESWPLTMNHVSNGTYRGVLSDTMSANLSAGSAYTAQVSADGGDDKAGYWEVGVNAEVRS